MDNGNRLLVLSILEGRHFPNKSFCTIIIDAKFDGESICSDAVAHTPNPNFNAELAWEVDRRALRYLHIKRTPVKLQAYVTNTKTGAKESIGYIVLDSRQAHEEIENSKPKWYPLLNSIYKPSPQMLMCLGLEKNVPPPLPPDPQPPDHPPATIVGSTAKISEEEFLPTLGDDGIYYIGSTDTCTDNFIFSITIGYAANLENLVSKTNTKTDPNRNFFFYYSLLGNDIVTDKFSDLNMSDFSPERASIKIRSCLSNLRKFFLKQSSIKVHLCSGEASLGLAVVEMDLIDPEHNMLSLPITLEDFFEITTSRHSQLDPFSDDETKPVIGISLALRTEKDTSDNVKKVEPDILKAPSPVQHVRQLEPEKLQKTTPTVPDSDILVKPNQISSSSSSQQPLYSFELTIDIKAIQNLGSFLTNAFVSYSWPYFGDVKPIVTDPVNVGKDGECNLPQGNTTVTFATVPSQLKTIFAKNPIPMDLLESHHTQSSIIGRGAIVLSHLINKSSSSTVNENGKKVERWTHSQMVSMLDVKNEGEKLAEIKVDLMLDDLGLFQSDIDDDYTPSHETEKMIKTEHLKRNKAIDLNIAERVAIELEEWKEWQESLFKTKLKDKEKEYMETLTAAWTRKETERETLFKKRLTEYNELEEKLKTALDAVEKRERQLITSESENQRLKVELQTEYDRLVQEVKDVSRRVKEECAHRNELERSKSKALQDQCVKWQRQITELEKKLELRESEFQAYKEQKERPEIRMQSQINVLSLEKAELERKNDSLLRSKIHYKQQYGKCLKELARIKQAMQLEAQAQLREKKEELCRIKQGLEKQQQQANFQQVQIEKRIHSDNESTSRQGSFKSNEIPLNNAGLCRGVGQSCLTLLLSEKEKLLQTGLYTPNDAVITQLDKEIQLVLQKIER